MKIFEILTTELKKENNFVADNGELKKWVVINKAQNYDAELLELLLENETLKEKFFVLVKNILIFKQNLFIQFLEQKNYLNDSYTQYKNKVALTIDGKYLKQRNEVALVWPFKDCVLEGGQSRDEQKREEIFFNEILAQDEITQLLEPKVLTNVKTFDKEGEHIFNGFTRNSELNKKRGLSEDTITDNLIIKGNNLLALHSLKKEFTKKIKLIYIDPPYNTGGGGDTFSYNNNFKTSTWLTFMANRLKCAKELLKNDGVLITAIDDNQFAWLRLLLEDIFPNHSHETVVVNHHPQGSGGINISMTHEYAIFTVPKGSHLVKGQYIKESIEEWSLIKSGSGDDYYRIGRPNMFCAIHVDKKTCIAMEVGPSLNINEKYPTEDTPEGWVRIYPIDGEGMERRWRYNRKTLSDLLNKGEIICTKTKTGYSLKVKKVRQNVYRPIYSNWTDKKYNAGPHGSALIKKLLSGTKFSFPKSIYTVFDSIKSIVQDDKNAIILDYHAGSGTTAHAVLDLNKEDNGNRQFILVEQMDYIETVTTKRVQKVIEQNEEGKFIYIEQKKYNQCFIEQIEDAKDINTLLNVWEQMKSKSFLNYNINIKKQEEHIDDFKILSLEEQKRHLCELLDKNQLYVNLSSLEDNDFECTDEEKQVTKDFYQI